MKIKADYCRREVAQCPDCTLVDRISCHMSDWKATRKGLHLDQLPLEVNPVPLRFFEPRNWIFLFKNARSLVSDKFGCNYFFLGCVMIMHSVTMKRPLGSNTPNVVT